MAKRKSARTTKSKQFKLDIMSVTVLLIMTIFGGIIGFYLGQGASAAQFADTLMNTVNVQAK
jgi:hypothetical protein